MNNTCMWLHHNDVIQSADNYAYTHLLKYSGLLLIYASTETLPTILMNTPYRVHRQK